MIALLGSLLGFVGSWIPELFKIFKDKSDKAHEITLLQMQMEAQKSQSAERITEITAQGDATQSAAIYQTWKSGTNWVDALNGTVRPVMAYGFFLTYAAYKYFEYTLIGANMPLFQRFDIMWTEFDQGIFSAIICFYYGQRAMNKGK